MPRSAPRKRNTLLRKRGGAFYLFGDESYLRDEAAMRIADAHLEAATRDFNLDQLRGGAVDPETLASACHTPPLMAEWRVVLVRDAQSLASSAAMRSTVDALVNANIPGLALVLVAEGTPKTKFHRTLVKNANAAEFKLLDEADLPGWLIARAQESGLELEAAAARALAAAAGPGLASLQVELEKLISYAADRGTISKQDVATLVGNVSSVNRWDWIDTVGARKLVEARAQLPTLFASGESGVGLVIALGAQFLRIAIALAGGERALARVLPSNQRWLAGRVMRQARQWTAAEANAAIAALLRADRLLKSAGLPEDLIVDEFLLQLQAGVSAAA